MLSTFKIRFLVILITLLLLLPTSFLILKKESDKRVAKAAEDGLFYSSLNNELLDYRSKHAALIAQSKQDNLKRMADAKALYESLIQQQPTLIAQHSTVVRPAAPTAPNTTTTSVKTATKPTTTRKSKSS